MATATLLKRTARAHTQVLPDTDDAVIGSIVRSTAGAMKIGDDTNSTSIQLGGAAADNVTQIDIGQDSGMTSLTTLNLATVATMTALNIGTGMGSGDTIAIGATGTAVNIPATVTITDLTVNGTTTTVSTTNLSVADDLIILRGDSSAQAAADSGVVVERGTTSADDAIWLWSETNDRFELGLFASNNGANSAPSDVTTAGYKDLKILNLLLDGTGVTFDGAGTVAATGAVLSLDGTGIETSAATITADAGLDIVTTTTGNLVLDSGTTGSVSLGVDAANAKTVTVGASAGASTTAIECGTGGLNLGTTANAHTVTLGSTTGASATTIQCGTGAMTFTAGGAFDVNAAGAVTIDSSGGTISIGADDVDQNINIATQGERNVNIGNNVGANGIDLETGTNGLGVDADGDSTWTMFDWTITLNETQTAGSTTAGNPYALTAGAGAAADAAAAGGVGGAIGLTAGVGGAGDDNPQDGGAGGALTITSGVGGVSGNNAGSTSGAGGDVLIVAADAGAIVGAGAKGNPGRVAFTSGTTQYYLTAAGTGPALATTAQTIIEAINEVAGGTSSAATMITTTFATTGLTVGAPCYVSALDTASECDADAVATSDVIGFVKTVGAAGTGEVVLGGVTNMAFEVGLNVLPGEVIYLSTVTGRVTNVAPSGTGDTVYEVGFANDSESGGATTDGEALECVIHFGSRVVV